MLVVPSILLKPNLGWRLKFSWQHNASHCTCLRVFKKPSGQFKQPIAVGYLVVIDPCDNFVVDHADRSISGPGQTSPRFDNIFDSN
jgi:hypothetical protein